MTVVELLKKARKRIEKPENWCQGYLARTIEGAPLQTATDSRATKWCSIGAVNVSSIQKVDHEIYRKAVEFLNKVVQEFGWEHVPSYNDGIVTTHSDVLELFDRAIAKAKQEEAANVGTDSFEEGTYQEADYSSSDLQVPCLS